MKKSSTSTPVPKQRRRRAGKRKLATDLAAQPDAGPSAAGAIYETNVAPDLIEGGRSPERLDVSDSECSLPAKNGAGTPD